MEKSSLQTSRSNLTASLPVDHPVFKKYPILTRCNSFSSSSSDSAVYYGSDSTESKFKSVKLLASESQTGELPKRTRNSSGSSMSSNVSCTSDKDISTQVSAEINKLPTKNENVYSTNNLFNESNDMKIKHEITQCAGEEVIPTKDKIIHLPPRILRRHIIKKRCACCPSTHTTVLVRRYRRIFKTTETTEKKTVISSTDLKTYVQNSTPTNSVPDKRDMPSPKSRGRGRRKSEIEKLYASLHEIEWAKNFSPDNILRQINVRHAASSSAFGPSPTKVRNSERYASKQRVHDNLYNSGISLHRSERLRNRISLSASKSSLINKVKNVPCSDQINVFGTRRKKQTCSQKNQSSPSFKSVDSKSSVNITCSLSHINLKKGGNIVNSKKSKLQPDSISVNDVDYCNDAQLLNTFDDSSSAASSSIVNIQSKHLLDLGYTNRNKKTTSDIDISDYSATPTFFDIAEEGIRTIDACFREVGAEVVVSTCYDDSSLPILQTVSENANINLIPDSPPVLKPYQDSRPNKSKRKLEGIKKYSLRSSTKKTETREKKNLFVEQKSTEIETKSECQQNSNHYLVFKSNKDTSLSKTARKIVNKYLRLCHNLRLLSKRSKTSKMIKSTDKSIDSNLKTNVNTLENTLQNNCNKLFENEISLNSFQTHFPSITSILSYDNVAQKQVCVPEVDKSIVSCEKQDISADCLKSGSILDKTSKTLEENNKVIISNCSKTDSNLCKTSKNLENDKVLTLNCDSSLYETSETLEQSDTVIISNRSKSACSLYETDENLEQTDRVITSKSNTTVITTTKVQCSISETKTLISSFVSTNAESFKQVKESVSRPLFSTEFSSYNSIKVNKSANYTQIILKLTRGKSIFLTVEALTELSDVVTRTGFDTNCQVLIINGIGNSFCLGVDLKPLVGPSKNISTTEMAKAVKTFIEALSNFKKPLAVVVSGRAVGLGMTLLNHADLTIASENATFCMPHAYLGYMPEGGACLTLPQAVGATVAMDLLIRGKTLTAREACSAGLISDVVELQHLPQELVSRVRTLVGNSLPALETTKAVLKMQLHVNLRLVLENEVKLLPRMWLTKACQDAMRNALCSGILSE